MSIFIIKIIACITMVLDHVKYAIPMTTNFVTLNFGRISYPLYAFLLTEGYVHTKDLKKYYKRLIIFALISQIPFMLFRKLVGDYKILNIIFTLLLGLIAITSYDKIKNAFLSACITTFMIFLGSIIKVDYSWYGVATIVIFYLFRENKIFRTIIFSILVVIYNYSRCGLIILEFSNILLCAFSILPAILILFYNGKLGKRSRFKYFYYWFYPVHMLILYMISFI